MENLRIELIQVAAVCIAILEDIDYGAAGVDYSRTSWLLGNVFRERKRQDEKWGVQAHDIATWLAILMEEVGEAAQAALDGVILSEGSRRERGH